MALGGGNLSKVFVFKGVGCIAEIVWERYFGVYDLPRDKSAKNSHMVKNLLSVGCLLAGLVGCQAASGVYSILDLKKEADGRAVFESELNAQDAAMCLMPHIEKTVFYVSKNTLNVLIQPFGRKAESWRLFATDHSYTQYVIEITPSGSGSSATLYYRDTRWYTDLVNNFKSGMEACKN